MVLFFEIIIGVLEIAGLIRIIDDQKYILEYKRDERIAYEYSKQSKEELFNIVDNADNSPL